MKLAVMVNNLGASQLAHALISQANELVGSRADADVLALYETLARPCLPMNFACAHAAEGWGFDGPVVATSLSTARKLVRFPSPRKKLFLVWDLEWLRAKQPAFRELHAVYAHPDLTLVARGADHAKVIADLWGRDPVVVDGFDLGRLAEVAG